MSERQAQTAPVYVGTAGTVEVKDTPKVKCVVHFRRHWDWKDYMLADNDREDMCYGFDWLGDYNYDFDGDSDRSSIAPYNSRYNYICKYSEYPDIQVTDLAEDLSPDLQMSELEQVYKTTQNNTQIEEKNRSETSSSNNTSGNSANNGSITTDESIEYDVSDESDESKTIFGSKTTTRAVSSGSSNNLLTCITALEQEYGATSIHGEKYYCSYLNVKFNKEITLFVGLHELPAELKFGENEDEIHLIAESKNGVNYNDHIELSHPVIKIGDLKERIEYKKVEEKDPIGGYGVIKTVEIKLKGVELKIKNTGKPITDVIYIKAYHIDKNTQRNEDKSINFPEIKTESQEGKKSGSLPRMVGQMFVHPNNKYYEQNCYIVKVKRNEATRSVGLTAIPAPDFSVIPSKYDLEEIKKILKRTMWQASINTIIDDSHTLPEFNKTYTSNTNESIVETKKAFRDHLISNHPEITLQPNTVLIFLHDYAMSTIGGYSNVEPYSNPRADFADAVMIFTSGNRKDVITHEIGHSLGLNHPFILETVKGKVDFGVGIGEKDAIYFTAREKDMEHIFWRGRTENIMDYNHGYRFNSSQTVLAVTAKSATETDVNYPFIEKYWEWRTKSYVREGLYYNKHSTGTSFWKWQWLVMQRDDELITVEEQVPTTIK